MKIAIYDPYLDTMSGGEKYMLALALCLQERHDVTLLWDKKEDIIQLAKRRFDFDISSLTFRASFFSSKVGLIDRYTLSRDYDLIIVLSDGSLPLIGCPLIVHFQSPMLWVKGKSFSNKLKLTRVKKIICNSQFTKSYIDNIFGKKSDVIYPPIMIHGTYDKGKKEKIILNVGRFGINQAGSSFKKQDVLISAFKTLVDSGTNDWKLILVMTVREEDNLALETLQKNVGNYPIEIVVNASNSVLWKYYEKASIYWHAAGYGEDLSRYPDRAEHFGIVTVEAMGAGVVPVVINAGGQKEIVDDCHNGRLWSSLEELTSFTQELIMNSTLLSSYAEAAVKKAHTFVGNRFCEDVKRLIA